MLAATCRADTDPASVPAGIETWLKCFFWLIGAVTALAVLWGKLFPKRQPPIEAEFVTKSDLEKFCTLRHSHGNIQLDRIETRLNVIEKEHEERARRLHERMDGLIPVVYKIAGRLQINVEE